MIIKFFDFHLRLLYSILDFIRCLKIPSKRFYFLWYHVQGQLENHHVHKIYETQLVCYYEYVLQMRMVEHLPTKFSRENKFLFNNEKNNDTLAFFKRDFTVKPSVSKCPAGRNRAFVSRRGDVARAIICCQLLESVSISHKWHIPSLYCLLTTTIKNIYCQGTILLFPPFFHL